MGVAEEAGSTARTTVDALKSSPTCLAAILLAAMFAVLTYLSLTAERAENHERQLALIQRCWALDDHEKE